MGADPPCCSICLDVINTSEKFAQPLPCLHMFHCHCLNTWLSVSRSCPLCRYSITLENQAKWFSLFTTAILVSHDTYIDRFIITIEFLKHILKKYKTSAEWGTRLPSFIRFLNTFTYIGVRFPCLDLTTRTMAQKELRRWKELFKQYQTAYPFPKTRKVAAKQALLSQVYV